MVVQKVAFAIDSAIQPLKVGNVGVQKPKHIPAKVDYGIESDVWLLAALLLVGLHMAITVAIPQPSGLG